MQCRECRQMHIDLIFWKRRSRAFQWCKLHQNWTIIKEVTSQNVHSNAMSFGKNTACCAEFGCTDEGATFERCYRIHAETQQILFAKWFPVHSVGGFDQYISVFFEAIDILKQREIEDSSTCSRRLIFPDWWKLPYVVILVTQFILLQVVSLVQIMVLPPMFRALQIPHWISIIESKQQTRDVRQRNYIKCYGFILNGFQTFVNPFILNGSSSINSKSPSVLIYF